MEHPRLIKAHPSDSCHTGCRLISPSTTHSSIVGSGYSQNSPPHQNSTCTTSRHGIDRDYWLYVTPQMHFFAVCLIASIMLRDFTVNHFVDGVDFDGILRYHFAVLLLS
jgi:hypothetical protein